MEFLKWDLLKPQLKDYKIIAFDYSYYSFYILKEIDQQHPHISIMSFSTDLISWACRETNLDIIIPCGRIDSHSRLVTGQDALNYFLKYEIDLYIITSMNEGRVNSSLQEHLQHQALKANARRTVVVNK